MLEIRFAADLSMDFREANIVGKRCIKRICTSELM